MDGKPYYNAHLRLDMEVRLREPLKESKLRASVSFKGQELECRNIDLFMKDDEEAAEPAPRPSSFEEW